ncbi:MAG: AI-2E family transporter [Pseudomonadota bacterium]
MSELSNSDRWLALAVFAGTGWLLYLLAPVLTPFGLAALFAYLGDPFVDWLEQRGASRTIAVVIVFLALTVIIAIGLLVLVPALEKQLAQLIQRLPAMIRWLEGHARTILGTIVGPDTDLLNTQALIDMVREHGQEVGGVAASILTSLSRSGMVLLTVVMNLVLVPVVTFYLLRDWDVMIQRIRELIPRTVEPTVSKLAKDSNGVLGAFLRGQLSVMVALGVVYSIGLWAVGIELGLLIGMVAGLISFVPYLGSIVGVGAGVVAAMFQHQDVLHVVLVLAVFGVGQALEGMVLTPLLVGDRIGLHPVAVIFAVLAGGQLFGFIGVLIALPAAAVINVLLRYAHDRYVSSRFYGDAPPEEGGAAPPDDEASSDGGDEQEPQPERV